MFTVDQALDRLNASQKNPFLTEFGLMTPAQQLQRINSILDTWYCSASWKGVRSILELTAVNGVISLPANQLRAESRIIVLNGGSSVGYLEIKPMSYEFQPGGPGFLKTDEGGMLGVAVDLGDDATGVRSYQLYGRNTLLDTYTYRCFVRARFQYITNASDPVIPDNYTALELSVRAMAMADANDNELSETLWAQAYRHLDSQLGEYEDGNDPGVLHLAGAFTAGSVPNIL